jgi:hypothetical protein
MTCSKVVDSSTDDDKIKDVMIKNENKNTNEWERFDAKK